MRDLVETKLIIQRIIDNGYAPAPWAHHPQKVKDAIRKARMRPGFQMCWYNCQSLIFRARLDAEYYEGWLLAAILPVAHCWLMVDSVIVDFTAPTESSYVGYPISREDMMAGVIRNKGYCPINADRINRISPFGMTLDDLDHLTEQAERNLR